MSAELAGRVVAVTGARGYVGSLVRDRLEAEGHAVVSLRRDVLDRTDPSSIRTYDLAAPLLPRLLDGVDAVVHAAWNLHLTRSSDVWRVNVEGTIALLDAARAAGVDRFVFVSSMSAYEGTRQLYGVSKLACERIVLERGGIVVRPGLVYGPGQRGMVGALVKLAKLPVIPLVGANARQFTVHEDDLARAIAFATTSERVAPGIYGLAHPDPISFRRLIEQIAHANGTVPHVVTLPWWLAYGALRLGEWAHLSLPFRADSLLGLVHGPTEVPNADALGCDFRPFSP